MPEEAKITIDKICQFTLLDAQVILRIQKLGYFPTPKRGVYDLAETLKGCFRWFKDKAEKRGQPAKPPPSFPVYHSQRDCFAATGIQIELQAAAKHAGCSGFKSARVFLEELLPFIFKRVDVPAMALMIKGTRQQELPLTNTGETVGGRPALDEFRAQREQIRLQKDRDEVIQKDVIEADIQQGIAELFGTLERVLVNEMPPVLEGMRALEIRNHIQAELESCKQQLKARFAEMLKQAEAA